MNHALTEVTTGTLPQMVSMGVNGWEMEVKWGRRHFPRLNRYRYSFPGWGGVTTKEGGACQVMSIGYLNRVVGFPWYA